MKLHVTSRQAEKKSEINRIRREGNVPVVIYSKGAPGRLGVVNGTEFRKILQSIEPGTLSSKILELDVDGKIVRALVKEVQYHPTTYNVQHLDFVELIEGHPVVLNVPLKLLGAVDCSGVKLGGILRQILRHVKMRCLPARIPASIEYDVKNLEIGASIRVADLAIPQGVSLQCNPQDIALVISRK